MQRISADYCIPNVFNAMKSHADNAGIVTKCLSVLWVLSNDDRLRNVLSETDLFDLLKQYLEQFKTEPELVKNCCSIVQRQAKDQSIKEKLVASDFRNLMLNTAIEYQGKEGSSPVMQASIGSLWNLLPDRCDPETAEYLLSSGAVDFLLNLISTCAPTDPNVCKNATGALWYAATSDLVKEHIAAKEAAGIYFGNTDESSPAPSTESGAFNTIRLWESTDAPSSYHRPAGLFHSLSIALKTLGIEDLSLLPLICPFLNQLAVFRLLSFSSIVMDCHLCILITPFFFLDFFLFISSPTSSLTVLHC